MSTNILGGNVRTMFYVGAKEEFDAALEATRVEQEAMCGYPLVTKETTRMAVEGHEEVIATFGPPETDGESHD